MDRIDRTTGRLVVAVSADYAIALPIQKRRATANSQGAYFFIGTPFVRRTVPRNVALSP